MNNEQKYYILSTDGYQEKFEGTKTELEKRCALLFFVHGDITALDWSGEEVYSLQNKTLDKSTIKGLERDEFMNDDGKDLTSNFDFTSVLSEDGLELTLNVDHTNFRQLVEKVLLGCGGKIAQEKWQSRYNEYVVYSYEPFVTDGFTYEVTAIFRNKESALWAESEFIREMNKRKELDQLLLLSTGEEKN